jgi:hypothetical protein
MKRIQKRSIHSSLAHAVCWLVAATLYVASQAQTSAASPASLTAATGERAVSRKAPKRNDPTIHEVQEVVARSGQNAFALDGRGFAVGDFNGDGSQDIVVAVRPASDMLAKVNSQYAIWKLEDPHQVVGPDLNKRLQRTRVLQKTVRVSEGDVLLMVIHGYGDKGWRDRVVNGIYVLKNVAGSGIRKQTMKESMIATAKERNPTILKGDVIRQILAGQSGFLFWTGAAYSWHAVN